MHAPVAGFVSQMDRNSGKDPAAADAVIVSVLPAFTVATEKAFEPLLPGKLRMPSPVGVIANATISATGVAEADRNSVFNPAVTGAGSLLVQS